MTARRHAGPSRPDAIVLMNQKAGPGRRRGRAAERLRQQLEREGIRAHVVAVPPQRLRAAARRAVRARPRLVVAAGGDGTVNAVAAAVADQPVTLGVVPLGTRNHFAKDLGIPTNTAAAIRTLAAGHDRPADVAEVNGRVFVNNSSLGVYPKVVEGRRRLRRDRRLGKWTAMALATMATNGRPPWLHVLIEAPGLRAERRTPFLFVGNNRYQANLRELGGRRSLDRGELCIWLAESRTRRGWLRLVSRAAVGRLSSQRDFVMLARPSLVVRSPHHRSLRVALDGEVVRMRTPLRYAVRRRALRVRVPRPRAPRRGR